MQNRLFHAVATALVLLTPAAGGADTSAAPDARTAPAPAPAPGPTTIPGLAGATLRPGWITPDGNRMVALDLQLQPGWKTYWRAPGDAGIPPQFDWTGSTNVASAVMHWPAPEVIDSAGDHTLGFHDRLVLPIEIAPATPGGPIDLQVSVDFGLCREVCVPAHVALHAPAANPAGDLAARPDPVIEAALVSAPVPLPDPATCRVTPIEDGLRIEAEAKAETGPPPAAALELMSPPGTAAVWVSEAQVRMANGKVIATADFVPPSGTPFQLDPAQVRLTLIGQGRAVQIDGCAV